MDAPATMAPAVQKYTPVKVGSKWFAQDDEGEQEPDGGLPSKKAVLDWILKESDEEQEGKAGMLPPDPAKMNMGPPSGMPAGMPPGMGGGAPGVPGGGVNPLLAMLGGKK